MPADADLTAESLLWSDGYRLVCSMDEVGRGCLAGPVAVGAVVVVPGTPHMPGLRDSKVLSAKKREALVPAILGWAAAASVGEASAAEIDRHGIVAALRLAGRRALEALPYSVDVVLLDGDRDYLSDPLRGTAPDPFDPVPEVRPVVKGDTRIASCAAASVIAKVHRDALMARLHEADPRWAWSSNSGYGSEAHRAALVEHGPCEHHRRSFLSRILPPG